VRPLTRIATALGCAAALASAGLPVSWAASTNKGYTETLAVTDGGTPVASPLAPSHAYAFAFTLANSPRSPQAFGSAEIAVPAGFTVSSVGIAGTSFSNFSVTLSGNVLLMTSSGPTGSGVPPGSAITINASVTTPPAAVCAATWSTEVKQSNDFSGTGNDFAGNSVTTSVGSNHLAFTRQPVTTEYDKPMTPAPVVTAFDPCGNTVAGFGGSVSLTDAQAQLATGSTVNAVGGVASFGNLTFASYGFDDTLTATATGYAPATSNAFTVVQLLVVCPAGTACPPASLGTSNTSASITAGSASTTDTLTATLKGTPGSGQYSFPACAASGETPYGTVLTVNLTNRGKTVTMTLPKAYVNLLPTPNGTPFWDICLSIPAAEQSAATAFTDKFGNTGVYEGLLPDCGTPVVAPCIVSRNKNAGNEIIRFVLVPGDPHSSWY
jgi:hypothetical protein